MSLRLKLLFVALSTLILPWAGWQFVRQTESLLRQGQEQTLLASASTLARALDALGSEPPAPDSALYVHESKAVMRIDGYAHDWQTFKPYAQSIGPTGNAEKLRVMLAGDAQWVYLYAEVSDLTRTRADARDSAAERSDHLDLTLIRGNESRSYRIASAAPGTFDAPPLDNSIAFPDRLTGEWQEDGSGYSIEMRIPRAFAPDHMRFDVFDSSAPAEISTAKLALLGYNEGMARLLARLAPEQVRVRVVSADGWLVAAGGEVDEEAPSNKQQGWLSGFIYRHLLAPEPDKRTDMRYAKVGSAMDARLDGDDLWQALSGVPTTAWRATESGGVMLVAAVPLRSRDAVTGALVLEQANPALPILANRALVSLLGASLLALVVTAGLLLLFGGLLSLRIRRLRNATERATQAGGRLSGPLPLTDSRDELGDLARSFGKLFDEVGAYTSYLNTLASKLSHELNTPLAIVKSSLDNLEHHELPNGARAYLGRARDGAERLGSIVRAMSESSRIERAISSADAEDFDLRALVKGCAEGYRSLAVPREIRLQIPDAELPFHGAPELLAQALDKLFDNARSFTPETGWITLTLERDADRAIIRMANSGPLLPAAMQDRLFDTLVSLRERNSRNPGETPHLGLGLYVVRLVAELHGGQATANNLASGDGVEFSLHLTGMPRRRLTGGIDE